MTDPANAPAHPRAQSPASPQRGADTDDTTAVTFVVARATTGCNKHTDRFFPLHLTPVDHVLGLALPGRPPLHAGPPFTTKRKKTETTLSLPRQQAERLHEFFEEFYTGAPKPPHTWNQHLFVRRVTGVGPLPFDADPTLPPRCTDRVDPHAALQPGTAYGVRQTDQEPVLRTLLAAADKHLTLSVVGWNKHMIIASGRRLYRHWYGTSMHRLDLTAIDRPADYPQHA